MPCPRHTRHALRAAHYYWHPVLRTIVPIIPSAYNTRSMPNLSQLPLRPSAMSCSVKVLQWLFGSYSCSCITYGSWHSETIIDDKVEEVLLKTLGTRPVIALRSRLENSTPLPCLPTQTYGCAGVFANLPQVGSTSGKAGWRLHFLPQACRICSEFLSGLRAERGRCYHWNPLASGRSPFPSGSPSQKQNTKQQIK